MDTTPKTHNIRNKVALPRIKSRAGELANMLLTLTDDKLRCPLEVSLSGNVLTIGTSVTQTLETDGAGGTQNSLQYRLPVVSGIDYVTAASTLDLTNGDTTGDFVNDPDAGKSVGSNKYIQMGIALRNDKKYYIVWGTEATNLVDTTSPTFASKDIQVIVMKLHNNGTVGAWKFITPVKSDVEIVKGGAGSGSGIDTFALVTGANARIASQANDLIWVKETETLYEYVASSSVTIDSKYVLADTSTAGARWLGVSGKYIYQYQGVQKTLSNIPAANAETSNFENKLVYVIETDTVYRYVAEAMQTFTVDSKYFLAVTGAASARWFGCFGKYSSHIERTETTATSGGSKTLTVGSARTQIFTGTANHQVNLPTATTLSVNGDTFTLINKSTGILTVLRIDWGGGAFVTMVLPNSVTKLTCTDNSFDAGLWGVQERSLEAPLRFHTAAPFPDSKIYIDAGGVFDVDGTETSMPPVSSNIPTVVNSSFNLQTGATTGATFNDAAIPTTTVGYFRRVGFTLLADGNIQVIWSGQYANLNACENPGTLFTQGNKIGWLDLEATAANAFKTAGSTLSVIESKVAEVSRVHKFGSGGGGSGTGDSNAIQERMESWLQDSPYEFLTPAVFSVVAKTLTDNSPTTATFDVTTNSYLFGSIGAHWDSLGLLDSNFLSRGTDLLDIEIETVWKVGAIDTSHTVYVSVDGTTPTNAVSMSQLGSSDTFYGTISGLIGDNVTTSSSSATGTDQQLNATTTHYFAQKIVVTNTTVIKQATLNLKKTGSPVGSMFFQIIKDSSGLPSTNAVDLMAQSSFLDISTISTSYTDYTLDVSAVLTPGTYYTVVTTDSAYSASFNASTTHIDVNSGGSDTQYIYNYNISTGVWSAGTGGKLTYSLLGYVLDLRIKVVAGTASTKLLGIGVLYGRSIAAITGFNALERQLIVANTSPTSFVVSRFTPVVETLEVHLSGTGQIFMYPDFQVNGNTVIFPSGSFNLPEDHFLTFKQSTSQFDNSDANAANIVTNTANISALTTRVDNTDPFFIHIKKGWHPAAPTDITTIVSNVVTRLTTAKNVYTSVPTQDNKITPTGTYPGSTAFIGGVLLPDGRVFCVPSFSTSARIYNPVTDTLSTPTGTYPGASAFAGGVLLPDGRVFCVPQNSTSARIYNPVTDTLSTPTGTYPGGNAFQGGVLLPDGRVFCVPHSSTSARIYNPVTDTLSTPTGTYPGSTAFVGGVLLPDGRVFCVPFISTSARIYNPVTDTLSTPTGTYPGSIAFIGGVLLPDGRVFCVPYNSTSARIYNPVTDTLSIPTGTYPGAGAFAGGVLLPDGRVFCVPNNSTSARIYNPVTDTVSIPTGTYPVGGAFIGGVLLPDGRVFCVPHSSTSGAIAVGNYSFYKNFSKDDLLGPFLNKY